MKSNLMLDLSKTKQKNCYKHKKKELYFHPLFGKRLNIGAECAGNFPDIHVSFVSMWEGRSDK